MAFKNVVNTRVTFQAAAKATGSIAGHVTRNRMIEMVYDEVKNRTLTFMNGLSWNTMRGLVEHCTLW